MTEETRNGVLTKQYPGYQVACFQFGFEEGSEAAERLFAFLSAAYADGYSEMHKKVQNLGLESYVDRNGFQIITEWNDRPRENPGAE